jgi:hypothetical protein
MSAASFGHAAGRQAAACIRVEDLRTCLFAAQARRLTQGQVCQLCTLTAGPVLEVDCHSRRPWPTDAHAAQQFGLRAPNASPLARGHIAAVFERVRLLHGRAEVLRTWGQGVRALRAEPRHVLNGGRP